MNIKRKQAVIVTGATSGIGKAICHYLKKRYFIIAIGKTASKLIEFQNDSNLLPIALDLTHSDFIERLEQQISAVHFSFYGLVNVAGASLGAPITTLKDEDWQTSFALHATAPMQLIRWIAPRLIKQQSGSIVNIGSPVGLIGAKKASYAASKSALQGLTMSAARELGAFNIRVNLLLPGATLTEMTSDWSKQKQESISQESFLNRLCTPIEVAQAVDFLLSDKASYFTGSTLDMTAGSLFGH